MAKPSVPAPVELQLSAFPMHLDQRVNVWEWGIYTLTCVVLTVGSLAGVIWMKFGDRCGVGCDCIPDCNDSAIWFFIALGFVLGVPGTAIGLMNLNYRRQVSFGKDGLTVNQGRFIGGGTWSLPYNAFRGVLHRTEYHPKTSFASDVFQILELVHDDPEKSIQLYVEPSPVTPRTRLKEYAEWFGLPILETVQEGIFTRPLETLEDPVAERIARGELVLENQIGEPPSEISILQSTLMGERAVRVRILARIWLPAAFIGVPSFFILFSFFWDGFGELISGEAYFWRAGLSVFLLLGLWMAYKRWRHPCDVWVSRSHIVFSDDVNDLVNERELLPFNEIEAIVVKPNRFGSGAELVVLARNEEFSCVNLRKEAAHWLRNYLLAAIARA